MPGFKSGRATSRHSIGSRSGAFNGWYLLFVEPRLIGNLDVVSVQVADVCREVIGAPFGPKARFLVGTGPRVYRGLVAGPDSVRALGRECHVKIFGDGAILQ